jgi:hypothetical protein
MQVCSSDHVPAGAFDSSSSKLPNRLQDGVRQLVLLRLQPRPRHHDPKHHWHHRQHPLPHRRIRRRWRERRACRGWSRRDHRQLNAYLQSQVSRRHRNF